MLKLSKEDCSALRDGYLASVRDEYAIIKASGATIRDYLQGQITQDIDRLSHSQGIYSVILTPQGKPISDLYIVFGHGDELIIIVRRDYSEALVGRLRQFALGHEVRIGIVNSMKLISIQGGGCDELLHNLKLSIPAENHLSTASEAGREAFVIRMAEAADIGAWVVSDDSEALLERCESSVGEPVIRAARIIKGMPTFGIDWNETVFPLNANLIEFEGVSFEKGCYVGQEVTSRMQWRGGIKKKLYRVQLESLPARLPSPLSTTVEVGSVFSAAMDNEKVFGIAHLPIALVESGTPLIDSEGDAVEIIEACHA